MEESNLRYRKLPIESESDVLTGVTIENFERSCGTYDNRYTNQAVGNLAFK